MSSQNYAGPNSAGADRNEQPYYTSDHTAGAVHLTDPGSGAAGTVSFAARRHALFGSNDGIYTLVDNDPILWHGENFPYFLAGTPEYNADGSYKQIVLTWNYPDLTRNRHNLAVISQLVVQRSPTSRSTPFCPLGDGLSPDDPTYGVLVNISSHVPDYATLPVDAAWTTIFSSSAQFVDSGVPATMVSNLPTTYTDTAAPSPAFTYRLILIFLYSGAHFELDWPTVSVTAKYTLTGAQTNNSVSLSWNDPVDARSLYTGFTVEKSSTPGVWDRLYANSPTGSLGPARPSTAIGVDNLPVANQYRVTGNLSNGLSVTHNDATTTPPHAEIQRMLGRRANLNGASMDINRIAVDSSGSVIIVGQMLYTVNPGNGEMVSTGGQDAFIAKYSPTGTCLWARHYGLSSDDVFHGVVVDSSDNIYALGTISGFINPGTIDIGFGPEASYGGADILLVKYAPGGSVVWHKLFGGTGGDDGVSIAINSASDLYITGTHGFFGTGVDFGSGSALANPGRPSAFLVKLHGSDGSHVWSKSYGAGSNGSYGLDVAVTSDGHVVMSAKFFVSTNFGLGVLNATSGATGSNAALVKCNGTTGATMWVNSIIGPRSVVAISVVADGSYIYLVGDFNGTADFGGGHVLTASDGGFYLVKFDLSGAWVIGNVYVSLFGGTAPHVTGVAISSDLLVVTGEMFGGMDFGQGFLIGQGGNDTMLARFSPNDFTTALWSRRGTPLGDSGRTIKIAAGNVYIGGGCSYYYGFQGFERNTGFGQTTIDTSVTIVSTPNVDPTAYWMRFTP